ncbi:aminodeoxychorismate lyase [Bogoriella caseilytica]|uniref:4-amino-4-deoxychorismate lyase n=1 Tax=Bogoriella caseilytica TaxID=56055 RepID=A0A3N2BDP2_9MICO|nr:aminodeoxychorismate lyase [Bogoriella caseilytica]ROR73369.1 4-amino-4-deoxychorismate lyase [Bogoriella caseilytica]
MSQPVLVLIDPVTPTSAPSAERLRIVPADQPIVTAADLGVTRGDGIFEVIGAVRGQMQATEAHLTRLSRSARMLDMPEPDLAIVEEASRLALAEHEPVEQLWIKIIVTRGVEGSGHPTAWVYAFEGEDSSAAQRDGIAVVRLDRGYRSDVAATSPWLLAGAKTLSYAVNKAVGREAKRRGADDVIFTSSDGYVLEGPTSTVIARFGTTLVTPPPEDLGILPGTTQAALFEIAGELGYATEYRALRSAELEGADGLWLVSSGQQIRPVNTLDGLEINRDRELDDALLEKLLYRTH